MHVIRLIQNKSLTPPSTSKLHPASIENGKGCFGPQGVVPQRHSWLQLFQPTDVFHHETIFPQDIFSFNSLALDRLPSPEYEKMRKGYDIIAQKK